MKLSPWFPKGVDPVHIGVYQTVLKGGLIGYQYWTGRYWSLQSTTIDGADEWQGWRTSWKTKQWRGILK